MVESPDRFLGTPCLNCGASIEGAYCKSCGQRATDVKQTTLGLLTEYLEHGLSLDSKFASTLVLLFTRPGQLTVDYIEGRRARYFSPVRLYLLSSLVFFWSLTLSGAIGVDIGGSDEDQRTALETVDAHVGQVLAGNGLPVPDDPQPAPGNAVGGDGAVADAATSPADSTAAGFWERIGNRLEAGSTAISSDPEKFAYTLFDSISKAMFLMLPLFALLVRLLNVRRHLAYLPFLVFALHIHAAYFLLMTFGNVVAHFVDILEKVFAVCAFLSTPVYIIVAMRRAFGGTWVRTWAKVALLMPVYGTCLGIGIAVVAVLQLLWLT